MRQSAGENHIGSGSGKSNSVASVRGDRTEKQDRIVLVADDAGKPKDAFRPNQRPATIPRERLLRDLAATADDVPLVLVTGPAGYGKTTVLRQWAAADQRPFIWVDLDERDNDPVRLLRHIALGMRRASPLTYAVWRALNSPETPDLEVAMPRLLAAAAAAASPWVLVLDDMHLLRGSVGPAVVESFVSGLPAGCHVVVAGRNEPGLRLGGLRSRGRCVEFGARELAFSAAEVRAVLATTGIQPTDDAVRDLLNRTDGWPAGVYLAARSGWGSAEPDAMAGEISDSTAVIFDYLREEVLHHEPAEVVEFLMRIAPLERMSGPLCDTVLESTGSAAQLAELASRNLFLAPLDAEGAWYGYHPMFREMLLTKLRRWAPVLEAQTHRRAARWYERQEIPEPAVAHALAGGDTVTAARLVAKYTRAYTSGGRLRTVRGWLASLTDGAMEAYPPLTVAAGWIWALTGDAARAQECLHAAERLSHVAARRPLDDVTVEGRATLASGVALLRAALAPTGVEQMLVDARQALDLEPPGSAHHPTASLLVGTAHLLNDDAAAAAGALERAAHLGRERQRPAVSLALALLSLISIERGDWPAAEAFAAEAAELVDAGNLAEHPFSIAAHVARAKVALYRGDVQQARHSAGKAMLLYDEPSPAAFPWLAAQTAIALGRVLLDLDDYPAARQKVSQARRHLARWSTDGVLGRQFEQLAEDVGQRGDRLSPASSVVLTAAEVRVLQLLPTHLTLSEIADALFITRNTVKTQVASIYSKLLASTRAEAVRAARSRGLVA